MSEEKLPVIGIPGSKVGDDFFGSSIAYIRYIAKFGIPRIISLEEEMDDRIDLLVLSGGADVNPLRYGQQPQLYTSRPDPFKEFFDVYILPQYIKNRTPIFGICRGIQTLAVHFGAQLVQHMVHPYSGDDRSGATHAIELLPGDFKNSFEIRCGKKKISVNSLHHQCVSSTNFPKDLEMLGIYPSKTNSSIEVIRHRTLPIYGVQYHPEELYNDPLGDFIVTELLRKRMLQKELKHATAVYSS